MASARNRMKKRTKRRPINHRLTTINYLRKRRRHRLNLALRGDNDRVTADSEARRADHGAALAWG